jgi:hypothetical protein
MAECVRVYDDVDEPAEKAVRCLIFFTQRHKNLVSVEATRQTNGARRIQSHNSIVYVGRMCSNSKSFR